MELLALIVPHAPFDVALHRKRVWKPALQEHAADKSGTKDVEASVADAPSDADPKEPAGGVTDEQTRPAGARAPSAPRGGSSGTSKRRR